LQKIFLKVLATTSKETKGALHTCRRDE